MILHLAEVGSTNDWLRENAGGLPDGQWLRADMQTAGRGRHLRPWESGQGNLTASCLIRLQPGEERAAELGFVAALALYDCVAELVDAARLKLKWPNDLLLDGGKLSGILLERVGSEVVLGIGVNLAQAPEIAGRATACLGGAIGPGDFCERLAARFAQWRGAWRTGGFPAIREAWLERAHPPGTLLRVRGGEELHGAFAGLAEDGALLLKREDGTVRRILAGDVWEG